MSEAPSGAPERIVVVGASLAGLSAAHALRGEGFAGSLTLVGDERHAPYDRPPLSKQVLRGLFSPDTTLPRHPDLNAEFRLGTPASSLDLDARTVSLGDGTTLPYDRLLIATGTRARPWPKSDEASLDGVFTLRNRDDATKLSGRLKAGPRRVVLVGGGFIGFEVASTCRDLDIPVTVLVRDGQPLEAALGPRLGGLVGEIARERGVDLRLGAEIERMEAEGGRLTGVTLKGGERIEADIVVAAIGAVRNVEWLEGAGLAADEGGVLCDGYCRVLRQNGDIVPDVFAAGDIARWPNPHQDEALVAVEHWGNARAQAKAAARNMLAGPAAGLARHDHLPDFWSQQFGLTIKLVGLTEGADSLVIAHGSLEERRFVALYGREGRTVAAASIDSARWLPAYAAAIRERAPFPPISDAVDQPRLRIEEP
ncbi:NAD(P)/FAD-dependent oxidoreductase [Methylorubrum salsuginis]|uniref:NADPH-dependent 2,4-dienoyl-CoA reductase, sulfur reductase n=1 Tax=Methylorubrum salsuginis TaxID=414703 RepID=A0A1I3Y5J4_9HYPH|nr:FAD-dependent oxidoreductase [Methylorubrum salsuginis]SFK27134.1 NADPH-dependent 2,4-dienoyl-CoA reductase, sulfur reductase [Methylorubrum salsuginis]